MNFRVVGGEDSHTLDRRVFPLREKPSVQSGARLSVAAFLHRSVRMVAVGVGMGAFGFRAG
jgi:hypothetical protein